jgi:hypothetical protein
MIKSLEFDKIEDLEIKAAKGHYKGIQRNVFQNLFI